MCSALRKLFYANLDHLFAIPSLPPFQHPPTYYCYLFSVQDNSEIIRAIPLVAGGLGISSVLLNRILSGVSRPRDHFFLSFPFSREPF